MAAAVALGVMSLSPPEESSSLMFLVFGGVGFIGFFVISRMAKKGVLDAISLAVIWFFAALAAAVIVGMMVHAPLAP